MPPTPTPSSSPTSSPSYHPTMSFPPSSPPTSIPRFQVTYPYIQQSHNLINADNTPSRDGFLLIFGMLLLFSLCVLQCRRKFRKLKEEDVDDDDDDVSIDEEIAAANSDVSKIDKADANNERNLFSIGQAFQTQFQRAVDTFTTQNRHVQFANKKQVQVYHRGEEPGMVAHESGSEPKAPPRPPTPILRPPSPANRPRAQTPPPRWSSTPIYRSRSRSQSPSRF